MTIVDTVALSAAVLMVLFLLVYISKYTSKKSKELEISEFIPMAAWLRAGIFFCFFYLVSWATGTMEAIANSPLYTEEQLNDPVWVACVIGLFAFIIFAYWGIWAKNTMQFGRKLDLLPQLVFGLIWGTAFGQMFLSFWYLGVLIGPEWASWQLWIFAYICISVWQALLMDLYWDIYISPEHDTPKSIKMKVPLTHIPNVTLCLIFFAVYENQVIFIALQTVALVGCTIHMRMPAPWSKDKTLSARRVPSIFFGLPRCGGYVSDEEQQSVNLNK
ncbi:hypothetical protein RGQ13_19155 [Thalassotalea psychrophila]|uniref:Uncharacterized protein n=1 Tax=Thalassotalea psychrophila TaxID=3065647 RepID=A0ABY9TTR6_9GAMM|nr:hypothetical protein RGQ13_19155 [Colwelliaceae bacterium SQ149]